MYACAPHWSQRSAVVSRGDSCSLTAALSTVVGNISTPFTAHVRCTYPNTPIRQLLAHDTVFRLPRRNGFRMLDPTPRARLLTRMGVGVVQVSGSVVG